MPLEAVGRESPNLSHMDCRRMTANLAQHSKDPVSHSSAFRLSPEIHSRRLLLRQDARNNSFIDGEGGSDGAHDGRLAGQTRALPQPVNRLYTSAMRAQKVGDFELPELVSGPVQLFIAG